MLDEIVGFNEQGFSLYIMSFWNTFDLGILLLLFCYYCMRLYGILMPDLRKHHVADMAYDILAANAVLLFPRLFSVLDHYRYFSQLLIAFRMMAVDLVAVFVLIIISCSGFFVAFTLSFGNDNFDAGSEAYALFQMLMGFTPAAWEQWPQYNILGKGILTLFLFICHFLIVTILITVLTNSFMAIVQNANEEHQFVFAVNAISMVKSDALFSYVAPTNVIAWLLTPLRFVLPFRQFVRVNRTVIKITHFPILLLIYAYERTILRSKTIEPAEMIEQRGRSGKAKAFDNPGTALNLFSPKQPRVREPSVATFHKDRALDEVFRRPLKDNTMRTQKSLDRRKTSNVVNSWMQNMGPDGTASPPAEQDRTIVDRLETRRPLHRRSQISRRRQGREPSATTMSVVSDPEEFGNKSRFRPEYQRNGSDLMSMSMEDLPEQTGGDGDDELVTNDDDDNQTIDPAGTHSQDFITSAGSGMDYFSDQTPKVTPKFEPPPPQQQLALPQSPEALEERPPTRTSITKPIRKNHNRHLSTNTIVYNPTTPDADSSTSPSRQALTARNSAKNTGPSSGAVTPVTAGRRTPKRQLPGAPKMRLIMPPRSAFHTAPNVAGMLMLDRRLNNGRRTPLAMGIGSDIGDNKAAGGGFIGGMPASFATQMGYGDRVGSGEEDQNRISRLMLARMKNMEDSFRDVANQVKELRKEDNRSTSDDKREGKNGKRSVKKSIKPERKGKVQVKLKEAEWIDEPQAPPGEKGSSI